MCCIEKYIKNNFAILKISCIFVAQIKKTTTQNQNTMKTNHTITDIELSKGGYRHDTLSFLADGKYVQVDGEFYIDKDGILHHTHIFPDGKEVEITIEYRHE